MGKTLSYIGIIGLVIIAVVLGYTIYQQQTAPSLNNQAVSTNQQYTSPPVSTNNSTTTIPTTAQPSADEIAVLNFPGPNATQAEIEKHSDLVASLSKKSDTLDITSCQPNPLVLHVTPDTAFTVINNGSVNETIYYGGHENVIPAKGEKKLLVKRDFKDGLGLFGYACSGKGISGILAAYPQ